MAQIDTVTRTRRERIVGDLTDAPVTKKQYGAYEFQPRRIAIEYAFSEGVWQVASIEFWGPRVIRGGRLSERSEGLNMYGTFLRDAPEWAREIADQHLPQDGDQ